MQLNNIFDSLGGDKRIERRVNSLFDKMVEKQSAVINKCFEDKAPKVGAYRVLRNKNWDMEDLIDRIRQFSGNECVGHKHVLCIQDTTELSYDHMKGRLKEDDPDFGDGSMQLKKYSIFVQLYHIRIRNPTGGLCLQRRARSASQVTFVRQ